MCRVGAGAPKIPPSAELSIMTYRVKLIENASLRNKPLEVTDAQAGSR
jgi:hypothetical protein